MNKIVVYTLPRSIPGTPNPSPFCVKLEAALTLAGITYELKTIQNPAVAPKGKAPFIEIDGERIGDSTLILNMLKSKGILDLDRDLTARQKAESHALQRMGEERLYWAMVYHRWMEPENWPKLSRAFFSSFPMPLRYVIPVLAKRGVTRQLMGHGMGLHSRDEIYNLAAADLDALSDFLGDQDFYFGSKPTLADATLYGLFVNIILPAFAGPLKDYASGKQNLVDHAKRMQALLVAKGGEFVY